MVKGEGVSGYYRIMSKSGEFVWMLSRATFVYDKHNGCPMYIVCLTMFLCESWLYLDTHLIYFSVMKQFRKVFLLPSKKLQNHYQLIVIIYLLTLEILLFFCY